MALSLTAVQALEDLPFTAACSVTLPARVRDVGANLHHAEVVTSTSSTASAQGRCLQPSLCSIFTRSGCRCMLLSRCTVMQRLQKLSRLRQTAQPAAMQLATAPSTTAGLMRPSCVSGSRLASPRPACCMLPPTSTSQHHSRTAAGALPSASAWLMCWCALQTTLPLTRPGATGAHPSQHCSSLMGHPLCPASHSRCRRVQTQRHTCYRLASVQPAQLLLSIEGRGCQSVCCVLGAAWYGVGMLSAGSVNLRVEPCGVRVVWASSRSERC